MRNSLTCFVLLLETTVNDNRNCCNDQCTSDTNNNSYYYFLCFWQSTWKLQKLWTLLSCMKKTSHQHVLISFTSMTYAVCRTAESYGSPKTAPTYSLIVGPSECVTDGNCYGPNQSTMVTITSSVYWKISQLIWEQQLMNFTEVLTQEPQLNKYWNLMT